MPSQLPHAAAPYSLRVSFRLRRPSDFRPGAAVRSGGFGEVPREAGVGAPSGALLAHRAPSRNGDGGIRAPIMVTGLARAGSGQSRETAEEAAGAIGGDRGATDQRGELLGSPAGPAGLVGSSQGGVAGVRRVGVAQSSCLS